MNKEPVSADFAENVLVILSNLPSGIRNTIIKSRINEFTELDEVDRREIIKNILANYHKLGRTKILDLFTSWLNALSDMDSRMINSIFNSYLLELSVKPETLEDFDKSFIASLVDILNSLPSGKKDMLWNCFYESVLNTPDPMKFLKLLPPIK
ncbi:MAG: hypothetical protein M3162_01985 [Thermoproteota archaeon]|nr:hypothetical protein [Thermoproteota archaeon]